MYLKPPISPLLQKVYTPASLLYHLPLSPLISHAPSATSIPTIEELMKTRTCEPSLHSTSIAMHKESHVGSKFKPKIRIVHIIAPEIIKTDAANFRELVQRLTGKPGGRQCGKKKARCSSTDVSESDVSESVSGCRNSGYGERVKEEEEMWGDENSAFFGGLGDLDGFIQGLGDLPLLPLSSSHMDVFGEGRIS